MLYKRRKRLNELAEAEARGESFWTEEFDEQVRTRILHAFRNMLEFGQIADRARRMVLQEEGIFTLEGEEIPLYDITYAIERSETDLLLTVIEALVSSGRAQPKFAAFQDEQEMFRNSVNFFEETMQTTLREHRIKFDLVDGEFVSFDSKELHQEVVEPVLTLLSGRRGFQDIEAAYQDALHELHQGKPDDAITDAATALEETLAALGCDGNSLGSRITAAKRKGLLAPHDSPMVEAIQKLVDWVNADRAALGDAHTGGDPSVPDAWLAVHVVGALILRLVEGPRPTDS